MVRTAVNYVDYPDALTAFEYDEKGIYAIVYDAEELTATMYDRFGKVLLAPWTEEMILTAKEFEALGLTAQQYDEYEYFSTKGLEVRHYDYWGKYILQMIESPA